MSKLRYLIIASEAAAGRGIRWKSLWRFLSIYHGQRHVKVITVDALRRSDGLTAETLLIGVPNSLQPEDCRNIRFQRAALFDYRDEPDAVWGNSNEQFLRSLSNTFLRPWVEPGWASDLNWGVLPLRRSPMLTACLRLRRVVSGSLSNHSRHRDLDVFFAGTATAADPSYNQRIEWLQELTQAPFKFEGGIIRSAAMDRLSPKYGDISEIVFRKRRLGFYGYFRKLLQTQIALTPAGVAPWSYRQYEAVYAGATLVSTDFRKIRTLIPLPAEGMIHVEAGASVVPAIERGLALRNADPHSTNRNIDSLESLLTMGDYSRKKPQLLDTFESQLDAA